MIESLSCGMSAACLDQTKQKKSKCLEDLLPVLHWLRDNSGKNLAMPERVCSFQGQNYHKLKRACLRRGAHFQDPFFPPTAQSLFYKRTPPPGITWKRPRELCKDPRLFVDGISTRDLHQGSLGNCWLVAATSCLASEPSLWKKVIPDHTEQEWNSKRPDLYAGIFHFRFWRLGRWTDVVIDDRLPVSEDGTLLFCRSATPREFWSALLEKAYAKLNGCYEALEGGNTAEALVDFTGGVSEPLSLDRSALIQYPEQRKALFQTLSKAHSRQALVTCSIRPEDGERVESVMECGLVKGHAYGVTAIRRVRPGPFLLGSCGEASRVCMVRLRNPWGTADWTGAWSQGSQEWRQLSRKEREKMGLVVRDVGEFWMEFEDFCRYFTDMVVCRLVERSLLWPRSHWREVRCQGEWAPAPGALPKPPVFLLPTGKTGTTASRPPRPGGYAQRGDRKEARLGERKQERPAGRPRERDREKERRRPARREEGGAAKKRVEAEAVDRSWVEQLDKRSRCGGCINNRDTFLHNPQFMFEVPGKEEEVLICLQQEDRRMKRREGEGENLPIGFEVLRVEVNRVCRVQCVEEQAASSVYMDSRSVALRVTLAPGRYALLPTTFQPGATGRFLLRLFSHTHVQLRELREELPPPSLWQCCLPKPCLVTTVLLHRASGLCQPKQTAPDVYAIIRCEEDTIKTGVFRMDGTPEFNTKAIFYRRRPKAPIYIELWNHGLVWDTLLGGCRLQSEDSEKGRSRTIELQGNQSCLGSRGCVYVETSSSYCLTDL
ncbi:calpain-5-like [Clupea harengus]|uniref:Calpain-5-like n=1 Tax=Clupea harengus TaxID=7950 RepID=A0A6P8H0X1_CLUHA|nr:calpain-5-like [Clupea harengus]